MPNNQLDKYQAVREAVIAAVPEAQPQKWKFESSDFISYEGKHLQVPAEFSYWLENLTKMKAAIGEVVNSYNAEKGGRTITIWEHRPIRLAETIHTLRAKGTYDTEITKYWDMLNDDLSLQSAECIDFLHSILVE